VRDMTVAEGREQRGPYRLVIVGWGRHGRRVLSLVGAVATATGRSMEAIGYVADRVADVRDPGGLPPVPYLGRPEDVDASAITAVLAGADDPSERWRVMARVPEARLATELVHPTVFRSQRMQLGRMLVAGPYAHLPIGFRCGPGCVIGAGAAQGHDLVLGAFCEIGAGASVSGGVRIGDRVRIGANAFVREGVRIGDGADVAPGSVVMADVPAGGRVAGIPARTMDSDGTGSR